MLIDGGFVRVVAKGLHAWLPLGMQVLRNIGMIIQAEMKRLDGQEILLPVVNPLDIWQASGRDRLLGSELLQTSDTSGNTFVMASGHEEALTGLLKEMINNRGQLPAFFYQIQGKVRDSLDSSPDLMRSREYVSWDSWGVHRSYTDLNNFIPRLFSAYRRIFSLCGLEPRCAEGAPAVHGAEGSYDFVIPARTGDYRLVSCEKCGYAADQQVALGLVKIAYSKPLPISEKILTKSHRLQDLTKEIGLPGARIAVCQLWKGTNGLVMSVIRADQQLSLAKLSRLADMPVYSALKPEELEKLGLVPEFLSPLGLEKMRLVKGSIRVIVDGAVAETPNLVMGSNAAGSYVANSNFGRDFEGEIVGDISLVDERNRCYHCGGQLKVVGAIRLAVIARLDDYYTRRLGVSVPENNGKTFHPLMTAAEIRLDRLVGAIAQVLQDGRGLRWPLTISPYKAVIIVVGKSLRLHDAAQALYNRMQDLVLWDDRPLGFLQKLRDSDRMGVPVRIIISSSTIASGNVSLLQRSPRRAQRVPIDRVKALLLEIWKEEKTKKGCSDEV